MCRERWRAAAAASGGRHRHIVAECVYPRKKQPVYNAHRQIDSITAAQGCPQQASQQPPPFQLLATCTSTARLPSPSQCTVMAGAIQPATCMAHACMASGAFRWILFFPRVTPLSTRRLRILAQPGWWVCARGRMVRVHGVEPGWRVCGIS